MHKRLHGMLGYGITALLLWCGCAAINPPPIPVNVSIVKPRESDYRNYKILKISPLDRRPVCEATNDFPDQIAYEIKDRKLFKVVQTATPSNTPNPDDKQTLVLNLSVVEFYRGKWETGVWSGGYIAIQCSLVEKITNSEIFNCKLKGPVEKHLEGEKNQGLENVLDAMATQIADFIQQGW